MKVEIVDRVEVYVNPGRDLHGPCVVRAGNGDLLLCHQDSEEHGGQDGFAHQWRSEDNGFTWQDEGPVADWRDRGGARVYREGWSCFPDGASDGCLSVG